MYTIYQKVYQVQLRLAVVRIPASPGPWHYTVSPCSLKASQCLASALWFCTVGLSGLSVHHLSFPKHVSKASCQGLWEKTKNLCMYQLRALLIPLSPCHWVKTKVTEDQHIVPVTMVTFLIIHEEKTRDHLSWKTRLWCPVGWSSKTGEACISRPLGFY